MFLIRIQNVTTVGVANSAFPGTKPISRPFKFGLLVNLYSSWLAEIFEDSVCCCDGYQRGVLSYSPSILITFEFLMLPDAAIMVGRAGTSFTVSERCFETCPSLPLSLPPTTSVSLIISRNFGVEAIYCRLNFMADPSLMYLFLSPVN